MNQVAAQNMDSLPKQFVAAMRTLFDIMDDKHTGFVRLTDIEQRWRDDRTKGLPRGVVESLQKVASPEGLLTFERFCTGLKICLIRNQVSSAPVSRTNVDVEVHPPPERRPPSAPLLDIDDPSDTQWNGAVDGSTQHRAVSMPQLSGRKDLSASEARRVSSVESKNDAPQQPYGPPKPPRLEKRKESSLTGYKSEDMEQYKEEDGGGRQAGDGAAGGARVRRTRREARRHTLTGGVEAGALRRLRALQQEKELLLQGLADTEAARDWFLRRLRDVSDDMRDAGRASAYSEGYSEAATERLELLRARVTELGRQLGALRRAPPTTLHLALPTVATHTNRHLTEELSRKNERISVLEREKSALIRELLLQRSRSKLMDNFT